MNVDVNLLLDSKKDVIRVSMDAISKEDGKFYVYVKDENVSDEERKDAISKLYQAPEGMDKVKGYKKQFVETGLSNKDYIEIISGINESDKVYQLNTTKNITEYMTTMGMGMGR